MKNSIRLSRISRRVETYAKTKAQAVGGNAAVQNLKKG